VFFNLRRTHDSRRRHWGSGIAVQLPLSGRGNAPRASRLGKIGELRQPDGAVLEACFCAPELRNNAALAQVYRQYAQYRHKLAAANPALSATKPELKPGLPGVNRRQALMELPVVALVDAWFRRCRPQAW